MVGNERAEPEEEESQETTGSSLSKEDQAQLLEWEHKKTGREWRGWANMTLEKQALVLGGFNEFDEYTNPEKAAEAAMEEAIASEDSCPFKRPKKFPSIPPGKAYDNWLRSLKTLFHNLRLAADDDQHWIKPEKLPLYYRFALRRPIMPEWNFQVCLQQLGVQPDFGVRDTRYGGTRYDRKLRDLFIGINWDRKSSHVSRTLEYMKPEGAKSSAEWRDEISNISEEEDDTRQILGLQDRSGSNEDKLNDTNFDGLQERPGSKGSIFNDTKFDDIISELTNYIQLYRSGQFELAQVIVMIKDHLAGIPLEDGLVEDILTDTEKDPALAAELMWEDACDYSTSSSEDANKDVSKSSSSSDDEAADQEQDTLDRGFPFMESTNHPSKSPPDNQPEMPPDHTIARGTEGTAEANNKAENDTPRKLRTTSGSTQASSMTNTLQGQATVARINTSHRSRGEEVASRLSEPKILSQEPPDSQRNPSPLTSRTNRTSYNVTARRRQRAGTPAPSSSLPARTNSPGEPVMFQEITWDGSVTSHGRPRSPEDGWTDDLCGLAMLSRKARGLGIILGLSADWVKTHIRTGSIQRKARKLNIAKNTIVFPTLKRRRRTVDTIAFPRSKRKRSTVDNIMALQRSHGNAKRKASTAIDSGIAPKSPKVEDHSDVFAVEDETSEEFVRSHCEPGASAQPGGSCPHCSLFRCSCEGDWLFQSDAEPFCPKCQQYPCSCERSSKPSEGVLRYDPSTKRSPETHKEMPAKSAVSKPSEESNVCIAFLSRVLDDDDVLASLRQLEQAPSSDHTIDSVRIILDHLHQGHRAGEVGDTNGEEDLEAIGIIHRITCSSEELKAHNQRLYAESRNAPPTSGDNKSEKSKATNKSPLLTYLSRVMGRDDVLDYLRQLDQDSLSHESIAIVNSIRSQWTQGIKSGKIGALGGIDDAEAWSILKGLSITADEVLQGPQNQLNHRVTEPRRRAKTVNKESAGAPPTKSNPMLAYYARVYRQTGLLKTLEQIEKEPMSKYKMAHVQLILRHRKQGLDAGKFSEPPRPRDKKDAEALIIMTRLQVSCRPMNAWKDSRLTTSEPKETNAFSGSVESMAFEPVNTHIGLGILNSGPSPALNLTPEAGSRGSPAARKTPCYPDDSFQDPGIIPPSSDVLRRPSRNNHGLGSQSGSSTGVTPLIQQMSFTEWAGESHGSQIGQDTPATSYGTPGFSPRSATQEPPKPLATSDLDGMEWREISVTLRTESKDVPIPLPTPKPGARELPGPPPSSKPKVGLFLRPPRSAKSETTDFCEPPASPKSEACDSFGPPPSPRPGFRSLSEPPASPQPGCEDSFGPPASPKTGDSNFFGRPASLRPQNVEWDENLTATAESSRKLPELENSPIQTCVLPREADKNWAKMAFKDALEYAQQEALKQRKSFSVYIEERRAVRTRMKQKNDEANAQWSGIRFFQTSNGSSGATSSNAISKLFDKYRGMFLSLQKASWWTRAE